MQPDAIEVLRSIDASLRRLVAISEARSGDQGGEQRIASEADLSGKYGDPEVKARDPRDWTGEPMQGRHFSQCPAEYLDMVASRLDYFCDQNKGETDEDKKKLKYQRLDASRARGWARRLRAGWKPTEKATTPGWDDDSVPF